MVAAGFQAESAARMRWPFEASGGGFRAVQACDSVECL